MKKLFFMLLSTVLIASCGQSYEESKAQTARERAMLERQDSLALKIGVLPTIDCLPMFIVKERGWIDTARADVRIKDMESHLAADDALRRGRIEGMATDIVRAERLRRQGVATEYFAVTPLAWQLITNKKARLKSLNQLTDKMIAVSRFSATSMLADYAVDRAKLKPENVFRVQINNPQIRLSMLMNNEIDAVLLPEPQTTAARLAGHKVLMDSETHDMKMGVIVFSQKTTDNAARRKQIDEFLKAYNQACDSINKYGIESYADVIKKYMDVDDNTVRALPKITFQHAGLPRTADIERAKKWLADN
ncbi:MAG: ABC transporter substrate-binding protein [Prevotella sp.]|uniref:ABC transporter substrate-binding protein n=1 Tax=Prevotella sp. TaxID=59823 RepID=UPI002A28FDC1|nr:ABC transporter substrate-binding protein [Prevotella sp.]MDD7317879.1 ABC transporter substrate-binding protein [Prevotellaceae bacterium]MDY4019668.1 ABC transporter substrate-binding protein [Prevotella sp.]